MAITIYATQSGTPMIARIRRIFRQDPYDPDRDPVVLRAARELERHRKEQERLRETLQRGPTGFLLGDSVLDRWKDKDDPRDVPRI
jgi:hypothetical protein